ncbi:STAS domain-containing protein [Marinibactrum halimedae]|uniref:STAS domain-containing protein n=1 Tax=Marinibactrum halimedae TaxID=1444977 RepID=A0AA37T4G6_9GAMM|nr:STAS domain-containing protein [Marinibactrum halimedae]MCD9460771.1 STAS domain-containing protein [Marinibactrum halimedae]GLS26655.1 hypothetical protein GCM10007877_23720 [Marinibactrum halimedae]
MQSGQILVAERNGVNVIKMVGDVRLTLCISFDQFIDKMFSSDNFAQVIFDLSNAQAIDSTTLGLMAKISVICQDQFDLMPVVVSPDVGINRLLETMGFEDIFEIVRSSDQVFEPATPLRPDDDHSDEVTYRNKVIEAHKVLMSLNAGNREAFEDLIQSLEQGL